MVLVVKLKNLNRRVTEGTGASTYTDVLSDSSPEYRSAEQDASPSPNTETTFTADETLDELSAALQKTNIDEAIDIDSNPQVSSTEETSRQRPSVDVLVAPAVIGHRWIRTRSSSFVVERPERIRAVLLGVAAAVSKQREERDQRRHQAGAIIDNLASLKMDGSSESASTSSRISIAVHSSEMRLSLNDPTPALKMIHALEDEFISPQVSSTHIDTTSISYASYLDNLCSSAPNDIPAAHTLRSIRNNNSPVKLENEVVNESMDHPSEVPSHLPQGDLYLCGSKVASGRVESGAAKIEAISARNMGDEPTPQVKTEDETNNDDDPGYRNEEHWRREGSRGAIEAALGTGCAAVDRVVAASKRESHANSKGKINHIDMTCSESTQKAARISDEIDPAVKSFVIVRPPGHHCNATQPSGFCWVNNAAVMAAHAFHQHGIDRVAILDFDLHHGNGTQSIAWRINADTVRHDLERLARLKASRAEHDRRVKRPGQKSIDEGKATEEGKRGLKIFYGSIHDIESFPCEDGNKELVTDASMCIEGAHGQWIWNIHLEAQTNEEESRLLYDTKYSVLIHKARKFFIQTQANPASSLIIISAGFDACLHEQAGMQRHGKSVPPSFYETFTRDAVRLADDKCAGKCVSILEGGYSDRALTSATIAHLIGLGVPIASKDVYQPSNLYQLEKIAKAAASNTQPRRKNDAKFDALSKEATSLNYTTEAFLRLEEFCGRRRGIYQSDNGAGANPTTPNRATLEDLWNSPRGMRSGKGSVTATTVN